MYRSPDPGRWASPRPVLERNNPRLSVGIGDYELIHNSEE
jgi:hypothetical protein